MVTREADSLTAAIVSVLTDALRAGFVIVGDRDEDLVSPKTVATRLDRSHESLRLIAIGKPGPGDAQE